MKGCGSADRQFAGQFLASDWYGPGRIHFLCKLILGIRSRAKAGRCVACMVRARGRVRRCSSQESLSATIFYPKFYRIPERQSTRAQGVATRMPSKTQTVRLIGAFAVLVMMALAASCRGFFVKATLSSITVGPATPSIQTGNTNNTVQMTATGTYNDGSTGHPSVSWSITPASTATISRTGLVTSVATGSATVTATSNDNPSITGTQTVSVTVGCIQKISISPTSATISVSGSPNTVTLKALADTCTQSGVDITSSSNWSSSNTQVATVAGGTVTAQAQGTVTISASSGGVTSTVNAIVTVNP